MSWIESQAHTWLAAHMCTHAHMSVRMCPHTHTSTITSLCGPPVRSGAPVPLWFSALWYHAGQIFLSAWMTPWHGVYLDWQLVFIWIDMQRREKKRLTEEGSGHQERAPICPDMKNMGWQWTPGRGGGRKCVSAHHGCLKTKKNHHCRSWWKCSHIDAPFIIWYHICLQLVTKTYEMKNPKEPASTPVQRRFLSFFLYLHLLYLDAMNSTKKLFSANRLPTSTAKGRLIKCHQSEMRVKWRGKSWIFTLIWLTPGGLQSLMAALICIVLCAPHPFTLTINSFNTFALI